jgi:predicted ArsR family transcriptional regulator
MLRGIAHPVRNRILEELSAAGPMRAADVAAALDMAANLASFHLRQLAKYGLVEEAPELARDGRDRVWRMVNEEGWTVNLDELAGQEGGKAAVAVFRKQWTADAHEAVERASRPHQRKDVTVAVSSSALRLTKAEAKQLARELSDLTEQWRVRGQQERRGSASARTYEVLWFVQPAADATL